MAEPMVHVEIHQQLSDGAGDASRLVAAFDVDAHGIHEIDGYGLSAVRSIPVVDPENGDRVLSETDPLRWAELLPTALRVGDLAVQVNPGVSLMARAADAMSAAPRELGGESATHAH